MHGRPLEPPETYIESTPEEINQRYRTPIVIPPGCEVLGEVDVENHCHIARPVIMCRLKRNLTYQCYCGCGRTYAGPGVDPEHAIRRWNVATFNESARIK